MDVGFGHLPLFVLDFCLDVVDGVGRFHLEGDRLPSEGLHEDLHLLGVRGLLGYEQDGFTLKVE